MIGQLGQELGIAVYDDPRAARQLIGAGNRGNEMTCCGAAVVHFREDFDTIPVDQWYRERNAWAVAGSEAHPFVARIVDMKTIGCMSGDDVRTLMQILPAVPRFLDQPRNIPFELDERDGKVTLEWV